MERLYRLSIIPLFLFSYILEAATIDGIVKGAAGQGPLAGVTVVVEASGKKVVLSHPTSSDGRFVFDPDTLFTADELDTYALNLNFTKVDYRNVVRVLRSQQRGRFNYQGLRVTMERTVGSSAIDTAHRETIEQNKSTEGRTLFFVPYTLDVMDGVSDPKSFHRLFSFHLKRGINTHLQSLGVDAALLDVSVVNMPVKVDAGNTEQVRAYGLALNALGIISGFGLQSDTQELGVSSQYILIPTMADFRLPTLYVDDNFQSGELHSTRLFERLNTLWGQNTVLALSLREIQTSLGNNDMTGLHLARQYLMAEKRRAGPDSTLLVSHIDALVKWIDRRLGQ